MAASDHLSPLQFKATPEEMSSWHSSDYPGTLGEAAKQIPNDPKLNASVRKSGVQKPVDVVFYKDKEPVLRNGHHRFAAALAAGKPVPIRTMNGEL